MKLRYKYSLIVFLGGGAIGSLLLFKAFTNDYFIKRNAGELSLKEIEAANKNLDYQLLSNSLFIYANQDEVNHRVDDTYRKIEKLVSDPHMIAEHPKTLAWMKMYKERFDRKSEDIYDFQTINTVIKNTTTALLVMQTRAVEQLNPNDENEKELLKEISHVSGSILLAKNGMDGDLLASLWPSVSAIEKLRFHNPDAVELAQLSVSHFNVIEEFFPKYIDMFNRLHDSDLHTVLENARNAYIAESNNELAWVTYFSYFLIVMYIISIGVIALFLFRSEQEARHDLLTRLRNRKAYDEHLHSATRPLAILLINIKKFKHYNDFYGVKEGDKLLVETAERIRNMGFSGENAAYYRLGADDFGIVFDYSLDVPLHRYAEEAFRSFAKEPIMIDGEIRTPSISIAASNTVPLLETADMALKSKHADVMVYHEGMNLRKTIAENMKKAKELKEALKEGRILPYFQPIVNLESKRIYKHESLGRIVMPDGQVRSIFPYLRIAQDSNLYGELSRTLIAQSFDAIKRHSVTVSINISIDDISDAETVAMIREKLSKHDGIGEKVIFEILESQAIEDYDILARFIQTMREYGCRIAIDDFGSGYSNFAHILNLSVDIIKIDASLIRNLDTDSKAISIVETIVGFARRGAIETVAEFVHNREVAEITEQLGIQCAQGFYFYEPAQQPVIGSETAY